jgi:hypothetical protein
MKDCLDIMIAVGTFFEDMQSEVDLCVCAERRHVGAVGLLIAEFSRFKDTEFTRQNTVFGWKADAD